MRDQHLQKPPQQRELGIKKNVVPNQMQSWYQIQLIQLSINLTKSAGGAGVKRSSKPKLQSFVKEMKSIKSDSSLLMSERVESRQTEFDEQHRAKISGATDIWQSMFTSSPDATVKLMISKVLTQLSEHLQLTKSSLTDQSSRVTQSVAQVMKDLKYTIPRLDPASDIQSTSKEVATTKADNEEKHKVEIDDEGFKIPQGTTHRNNKKLEADEHQKVVERILDRELDPSGILVDEVKVRHELKPYGLNDKEWRYHLIFLKNKGQKMQL